VQVMIKKVCSVRIGKINSVRVSWWCLLIYLDMLFFYIYSSGLSTHQVLQYIYIIVCVCVCVCVCVHVQYYTDNTVENDTHFIIYRISKFI